MRARTARRHRAKSVHLRLALAGLLLCAASGLPAQTDAGLRVTYPGGSAVLQAADLAGLPQDSAKARFHDGPEVTFTGPSLLSVLRLAGARVDTIRGPALGQYVLAVARDGYRVAFSLGELAPALGNARVMVVTREDGKPLADRDGPWRLWVPGDQRPSRSARQVVELLLVQGSGVD